MLNKRVIWLIIAVVLGMGLYIVLAAGQSQAGFPLDDAWIHQTYARNLVRSGRWEFVPGVVSAGSTAPLWTLLLALGYLLHLPYLGWTYGLGGLSLLWLAWAGMQVWRLLWPTFAESDWIAGLVLVLLWPLIWAAVSGMETLLFAAIGLQVVALALQATIRPRQLGGMGFLCGLLVLTRPDGVVLVLLVVIQLLVNRWHEKNISSLLFDFLMLGIAVVIPLLPYFFFNLNASGTIWPNTFYAKQAEYGVALAQPFLLRVWQLLFFSLGGSQGSPHVMLVPGLVWAGWLALQRDWREKCLMRLLPLLWAGGHVILYAWRLPVVYQHGRYLLPAIPIWVLYGLAGWRIFFHRLSDNKLFKLGKLAANLSFSIIMVIFLFLGALNAYANDVAFIEGEMVTVARWLRDNTSEDALIASHDIGAIGYFAERPLLDLAGLISPEVIEFIADDEAISHYILDSDADYLVTAPGWPYIDVAVAENVRMEYSTNYDWTREQGLNNMTVFLLP